MTDQLQKQITKGKLKKGDKLPIEPELMKIFGVSRSTIREAVIKNNRNIKY
ncbi:GntR family transcriptional regulator [Bacteroides nordii]|uniref:GntR family transcriptional regulator n=1 Tax=Bacteroides nordii TaxID=291645 RepID=UPI00203C0D0D|nr:GntR family transcriptional regulator [Bacteroides nordii]